MDAIHMDDYFYPYRIAGKEFPDDEAYERKENGLKKDEWRRSNWIYYQEAGIAIKKEKPW